MQNGIRTVIDVSPEDTITDAAADHFWSHETRRLQQTKRFRCVTWIHSFNDYQF